MVFSCAMTRFSKSASRLISSALTDADSLRFDAGQLQPHIADLMALFAMIVFRARD